jgi:hypothetical protein
MYQSRRISIYLKAPLKMNLNSYLLFGCSRYSGCATGLLGGFLFKMQRRKRVSEEHLATQSLMTQSLMRQEQSLLRQENRQERQENLLLRQENQEHLQAMRQENQENLQALRQESLRNSFADAISGVEGSSLLHSAEYLYFAIDSML